MPKDVYDLLDPTQLSKGRRHFRNKNGTLHPSLVSAWPQCPAEHHSEAAAKHQFQNSWANSLQPPMPQEVYESLSPVQRQKGYRHFIATETLHPDLASSWSNCPSEHRGNPQPKLGRPIDPASEWHQLKTEFPLASDAVLKRKQAELKRSRSRFDAHAQTKVVVNVDALRTWLLLFPTDRRFVMARKVLSRAMSNPERVILNFHWRRFDVGRMYAGPWASLASMDRSSRAVALIGSALLDVDFNNAHPR